MNFGLFYWRRGKASKGSLDTNLLDSNALDETPLQNDFAQNDIFYRPIERYIRDQGVYEWSKQDMENGIQCKNNVIHWKWERVQ